METEAKEPKASKKKGGNGADLGAVTEALQAVLKGDLKSRVTIKGLAGDAKQLAELVNAALANLSAQIADAETRKQHTAAIVDNALEGLIALVRQGELSRWNSTSEDPLLGPLLDGFGKVIETLRTFVREINEAALRL